MTNTKHSRLPTKVATPDLTITTHGCLIHDAETRTTHYLNLTGMFVLECCDGATDAGSIAARLQDAFQLPSPPLGEVEGCLATLSAASLVSWPPEN